MISLKLLLSSKSWINILILVVFQTFSKAWGCAAIRLGMAFASEEIIDILSKIKYPYNVNQLTQQQAIAMLHKHYEIERWVKTLKEERDYLEEEFEKLTLCLELFLRCQLLLGKSDGCCENLQLFGR